MALSAEERLARLGASFMCQFDDVDSNDDDEEQFVHVAPKAHKKKPDNKRKHPSSHKASASADQSTSPPTRKSKKAKKTKKSKPAAPQPQPEPEPEPQSDSSQDNASEAEAQSDSESEAGSESGSDSEEVEVNSLGRRVQVVDATALCHSVNNWAPEPKRRHRRDRDMSADVPLDSALDIETHKIVSELLSMDAKGSDLRRSIADVGAEAFTGRKKKQWERQKLKSLGAHLDKEAKVPFKMLQGMRRKGTERDSKKRALDLAAGNKVQKKQSQKVHTTRDDDLFTKTGKFSRGKLRFSNREIKDVNRSGGHKSLRERF